MPRYSVQQRIRCVKRYLKRVVFIFLSPQQCSKLISNMLDRMENILIQGERYIVTCFSLTNILQALN